MELLIVTTIIAVVSVTGFKIFSSLEESSKNTFVQTRIRNLVQELDREVEEGALSDYVMQFSKNTNGIIVNANTYRVNDLVKLDYSWATKTGSLTFSGSVKPGFALISENRTYYREMRTSPATTMNFTLSGTFDIPQQIITADNAVQKNVFLIFPLDTDISGTKFLTNIDLPSGMTGVTLKNIRSQKSLYDANGITQSGVTLDLTR